MVKFIKKVLKGGWSNFRRQGFLSFATSLIIFIVVSLATSLYFFEQGVSFVSDKIRDKMDVSVYFKENVTRESILEIREKVIKMSEVKSAEYVSAEEAYERFEKNHQDDDYLKSLWAIQVNPFSASLLIKTNQTEDYKAVSQYFKTEEMAPYVREVNDYKRGMVIEKFSNMANTIEKVGFFLTIFLSLVALVIAYNTVRLSIYSQRMEIKVMHLVGAKNNFIKWPFLIQGALCGFFASLVCLILFYVLFYFLKDSLVSITEGFDIYAIYMNNLSLVIMIQFGTGIGLGLISSYFAVRKYLKG
ncbi:MAG: permease-like cell division protein FtsX [Minisyncoccus archaeiphilus]|uniref:cell division protein FtsX n=1 Tax=Minisyncoccus archaeiphilus TaxID=3238481 RepID=UPI002B092F4F|nr:MAG: permease-like cell division protein FtsX [Candidatus Parcubacteria bacterium]